MLCFARLHADELPQVAIEMRTWHLSCLVGAVITKLLSGAFEAGLSLAPLGLVLGVAFAVAVGVFAGVFPSLAAARLTPVEALHG